jgi:transcriptional regulator with XRE-family HTH domain
MTELRGNGAGKLDASFGAQLRAAREACQLTQEDLAARAGLTPNTVGCLERGEHRHPYPATVRALADALDLSAEHRAVLMASVLKRGTTMSPGGSDEGV